MNYLHVDGIGNLITDTHLGKVYKTGVSLDKLGVRENMAYEAFEKCLHLDCEEKTLIHLGDLFDSPVVPLDVIMRTYRIISLALMSAGDKWRFYFLAGNHDLHRDSSKTSAIYILATMLANFKNCKFVLGDEVLVVSPELVLCPYSYKKSVDEMLNGCKFVKCVLGHFEEPIDPSVASLHSQVYSGHIHNKHKNGNVDFIGAVLPTSHGDADDDTLYTTVDLETLLDNTGAFKNKCVRVLLKEGEVLPEGIDCLALTSKKEEVEEERHDLNVGFEEFDLHKVFCDSLSDNPMSTELWERYEELRNAD